MEPEYEVCVVGAGITGLNALVVASGYLSPASRVALVDARSRVGGMWVDTYDYVRLHQPHPIFTAGNIPWQGNLPPSHLASKQEVLVHFGHCLDVARRKAHIDEHFDTRYESHTAHPDHIEVVLRGAAGQRITLRTKRLIKAFGNRVQRSVPLVLTSSRVHSVTPETLDLAALGADDAPIWIVGSGKTAMDTAGLLIRQLPGRAVHMATGPGTFFGRRETFFPTGMRRWWDGTPINTMLRHLSDRFDGTNEQEVATWFRSTYGLAPLEPASHWFSAYLSDDEAAVVSEGLASAEPDYLTDAVDHGADVELRFRSGGRRIVPAGTTLINCTGFLLREEHAYEPYVSAGGRVASIQMNSSVTGVFSSFAGYYLTHLMFRDKLAKVPLYQLDVETLSRRAPKVAIYASISLSMYNLGILATALPPQVINDCGLDFDRWYPMPRRMAGALAFLASVPRSRPRLRAALDTIGKRFDVRVGPLVNVE